MVLQRTAAALLLILAATVVAQEDAKAKVAREELERQMHSMVEKPPAKIRIDFIGLDDPNYRIEEVTFELDDRGLSAPSLTELSEEGPHLIWNGDVTPGKHTVKVLLVFANRANVVMSDEGGYKWKIGGDTTFEVNAGLEVRVQVTPTRDGKNRDISKRFKLALPAQPVMIAKLDDGSMPAAMARHVVDAGVDAGLAGPTPEQLAEEKKKAAELATQAKREKAAQAAEAKRLAAEARKQAAADAAATKKEKAAAALEAKRAAAAEKKEKAAAALEAKRATAQDKKLAALQAAEDKKLAAAASAEEKRAAAQELADEKKRLAQAAIDAKNPPAVVAALTGPVAVAEPIDAGVEAVDAGPPVEVAVAAVDAGTPAPVAAAPVADAEGPPWLMIGIAGGVAALLFLLVVARRRSRPPTLDE